MIDEYLPFLLAGITTGSIFSLAAAGLVLTQKTSGVFNFAHGAVAAAGAYAFHDLWQRIGLPWPLAALVTIGVLGPLLGLVLEACMRALASARPVMRVVATVGALLTITGALELRYGGATLPFPQYLPSGTFRVGNTFVGYDQVITVAVAAGAAVALARLLGRTRTGIAMRGVVDDANLLSLAGVDPAGVRRTAWMIGAMFAVTSGVLIGPFLGLDAFLLTLLVVQAFAAAAVGRFSSLPLTYAGGLAVGVLVALADKFVATRPDLSGVPASIPFLVLFGLLVLRPSWLPHPPVTRTVLPTRRYARTPAVRRALLGVAAVVLFAVPHVVGARLPLFLTGAALSVVFLSIGLLVWTAGQISLAHAAFVAVGAAVFSHVGGTLPFAAALAVSGLAVVPLGLVVALPAVRLSGVYLALATLGFGILMQQLGYPLGILFGQFGQRTITRPDLPLLGGRTDTEYFYVVVLVAAVCFGAVQVVLRTRLGRLLRAVGDDPIAVETHGASASLTLVTAFCLAAFLAGVGGALLGGVTEVADPSSFGPFTSLLWIAVVALAGRTPTTSAVIAALLLAVAPGYLEAEPAMQTLGFGLAALTVAVLADSGRLAAAVRLGVARSEHRRPPGAIRARVLDHHQLVTVARREAG